MHRTDMLPLYAFLTVVILIIVLGGLSLALFGFGLLT